MFRPSHVILFLIKLFKTIKILRPDIIVCEEPSSLNTQLLVSRLLRIPFIWYIHNENQFVNVNKTILHWSFKYFFKNNLYIISVSNFTLKKNLDRFKEKMNNHWHKIPILPVTSDLKSIFNKNNQQKNILGSRIHLGSIGRLTWHKDYELLIRVFAKLRKQTKKEFYLSIAGIGPMYDKLTELIQELGLEKYVYLAVYIKRKNIPAFLSSLDIYVQSSITEGSPLTIKEAMATSLPILATNVGGIPEMIINKETGILVPHDDQDEFTRALIELVNMDVANREKMGKRAYNYAMNNYSMELLAKKNAAIYNIAIKKNQ